MTASKSSSWNESRLAWGLGMALMASIAPAHAEEGDVLDTLQLHGFLSQALVITDDNDFFGPSSDHSGSLEFTEIGANVSLRPHEDVLIAAQLLSRRAGGEGSDADPTLDYGLIDYQLHSNQRRNIGIQLGRFKNPFGFYNQTRDVAFTRPSILLPQSIYFDRTRSLALSADGISLYAEERIPSGTLRFQVGTGKPKTNRDLSDQLFQGASDSNVEPDGLSSIAQLLYEHQGGKFVTALSVADVNLKTRLRDDRGQFDFQPWILSAQYNEELWSLTGEFAIRNFTTEGSGAIRNTDIVGESWYLQYQRRFLEDWQWLIRYDDLVNNRDDRDGDRFTRRVGGAFPSHSQFAKDWTLGLQWTPTSRLMLAGEYHYVDGTGWLPTQDNPDPSETERYWNMLLFQVSLRF